MSNLTMYRLPGSLALTAGLLTSLVACGGNSSTGDASATPTASANGSVQPTAAATPTPVVGRPTGSPTPPKAGSTGTTTMSYAQLVDVWRTGTRTYALSYDRVDLLTGRAAAAYYKKHPEQEPRDWALSNENTLLRQLPVASTATFYGNQLLGGGNGTTTTKITGSQLMTRLKAHPRALVKVSEKPTGNHREVTKIVEVYLP